MIALNQNLPASASTHHLVAELVVPRGCVRRAHGENGYQHYRQHLEPVIPILQPVIERLGYTVD